MTTELTDDEICRIYTKTTPGHYIVGRNSPELIALARAVIAAGRAARGVPDEMDAIAAKYAHKLALDLECVLADYSGEWWDTAIKTLGAYREAMNAIHERESPTCMGEPVIAAAPQPAPTSVSRSKRASLEADGYIVNGVSLMHPETRQRVLLDYCGFVGWWHGQVHHDQQAQAQEQAQPERKPMTDAQATELIYQRFITGPNLLRKRDVLFRSAGTPSNVWGMDLIWLIRETEAMHGIKDAP